MVFVAIAVASGSYSSLDRCVFHGERLAPQVIHRPLTPLVSTLEYFTRSSLPVVLFWSSVSTAIGDGSMPYIDAPAMLRVVYSNCTTANTVLPLTPATFALSRRSSDMPSGQSEKNWRLPGSDASSIG